MSDERNPRKKAGNNNIGRRASSKYSKTPRNSENRNNGYYYKSISHNEPVQNRAQSKHYESSYIKKSQSRIQEPVRTQVPRRETASKNQGVKYTAKNFLRVGGIKIRRGALDYQFLLTTIILVAFGMIMLYSASSSRYASRRRITDVTEYTPYYDDILKLYRCGISVGSDETGSFLPDSPITRGAAAAMLTRMVDPSLRLTPDWHLPELYSAEGAAYEDLVTAGTYIAAPETAADYDQAVRYMLSQGENTLSLKYDQGFTVSSAQETLNNALLAVKRYCEQGYNNASCSYNAAGTMILKFSSIAGDRTEEYRSEALTAAIAVHDALWQQGTITPASTQREIAWAYYQWIAANCTYDAGDNTSVSHLPYSLFHNGKAVCDGYTGAYNLLLKLEGIDCYALPNATHIWTVATLDGETVHIDATWGDQGNTGTKQYFAMTPEQSYALHPWPKENELPQ